MSVCACEISWLLMGGLIGPSEGAEAGAWGDARQRVMVGSRNLSRIAGESKGRGEGTTIMCQSCLANTVRTFPHLRG